MRSVDDLPEAPDAAFVAVKREPTIDIVGALARRGAGGAVVYASGFAEVGGDGPALQDELVARRRRHADHRAELLRPHQLIAKAALWPDEHGGAPRERGVAIVTQSGNIAINFTMTSARPAARLHLHARQPGRHRHRRPARRPCRR